MSEPPERIGGSGPQVAIARCPLQPLETSQGLVTLEEETDRQRVGLRKRGRAEEARGPKWTSARTVEGIRFTPRQVLGPCGCILRGFHVGYPL